MSLDMTCESVAPELSALLDDELSPAHARAVRDHLATCERCRSDLASLADVRRTLRTSVVREVPDLVAPIVERIEAERTRTSRREEWNVRARIAGIAAAAAALVLAGAWLPGTDDRPGSALAAIVAKEVRAEARSLDTYRATFSIVERGWHPEVQTRSFSAEIEFEAPQSFRLAVDDETAYPSGEWPVNDVRLIANPRSWWIRETSSCPPASLPGCRGTPIVFEERSLLKRQPFDGTIGLPTDIVLPVQTLTDSPTFEVERAGQIQGRDALHVSLSYREALPLISSLQAGGSWRTFYPSDRVDLWIDQATGFPLRFEVQADTASERRVWAARQGYDDPTDAPLLEVTATDFSQPRAFAPGTFDPPEREAVSARGGTISWGGFTTTSFGDSPWLEPRETFDLEPFIAGRTSESQRILSYTRGMEWLKILGARRASPELAELSSEELRLPNGNWAYYRPATWRQGRTLEMFAGDAHVLVETNLPRDALIEIAGSIDFDAGKLPRRPLERGSFVLTRADHGDLAEMDFVRFPSYLPTGYRPSGAFTSRTPTGIVTATSYYRSSESEYDGLGIRITQSKGVDLLPPSPEDAVNVSLGDGSVRWFPLRGEIDWIEGGVYTSISAPSLPRAAMLRIAEGLE